MWIWITGLSSAASSYIAKVAFLLLDELKCTTYPRVSSTTIHVELIINFNFKTSVRVDLQNFGLTIPQLAGTIIGIGWLLGLHLAVQNSDTTTMDLFTIGPSITSLYIFRNDTTSTATTLSTALTTAAASSIDWNDVQMFFNIPTTTPDHAETEVAILSGALFLVLLSFIGTTLFAFKNMSVTYPLEREVFFLPSYR